MDKQLTYKPFGNKAILIEWKAIIDAQILSDILSFKEKISTDKSLFITDVIMGYHSLTLVYKNEIINFDKEVAYLKLVAENKSELKKHPTFTWQIPVCYDESFGIDLQEISETKSISIPEIIQLHTSAIYKVYFIGFLPGFLYLGGLNSRLFMDRKPNPRLEVAKGAVAIGGKQTGVYPEKSAGGWNIIGKSPISFFNVNSQNPCFANPGDAIKFKSISLDIFYEIEEAVAANNYKIPKTLQHD